MRFPSFTFQYQGRDLSHFTSCFIQSGYEGEDFDLYRGSRSQTLTRAATVKGEVARYMRGTL